MTTCEKSSVQLLYRSCEIMATEQSTCSSNSVSSHSLCTIDQLQLNRNKRERALSLSPTDKTLPQWIGEGASQTADKKSAEQWGRSNNKTLPLLRRCCLQIHYLSRRYERELDKGSKTNQGQHWSWCEPLLMNVDPCMSSLHKTQNPLHPLFGNPCATKAINFFKVGRRYRPCLADGFIIFPAPFFLSAPTGKGVWATQSAVT